MTFCKHWFVQVDSLWPCFLQALIFVNGQEKKRILKKVRCRSLIVWLERAQNLGDLDKICKV